MPQKQKQKNPPKQWFKNTLYTKSIQYTSFDKPWQSHDMSISIEIDACPFTSEFCTFQSCRRGARKSVVLEYITCPMTKWRTSIEEISWNYAAANSWPCQPPDFQPNFPMTRHVNPDARVIRWYSLLYCAVLVRRDCWEIRLPVFFRVCTPQSWRWRVLPILKTPLQLYTQGMLSIKFHQTLQCLQPRSRSPFSFSLPGSPSLTTNLVNTAFAHGEDRASLHGLTVTSSFFNERLWVAAQHDSHSTDLQRHICRENHARIHCFDRRSFAWQSPR